MQTKTLAKDDQAAETDNRVVQYAAMLTERKETIQLYTKVIVGDGFFMKKSFIDALTEEGFVVCSVLLKRKVKAVYVAHKDRQGHEVLISTNVGIEGGKHLLIIAYVFRSNF